MKSTIHSMHFVVLVLMLCGSIGSLLLLQGNHATQLIVGIVAAVSYAAWGIIHHTLQKDLHVKIVVEYVLMGAIAIALLFIVLGS